MSQIKTANACLANSKLIVIKLGSAVLTTEAGEIDLRVIDELADTVNKQLAKGKHVVIVTSGAVAAGRGILDMVGKRVNLSVKQALAAVGQTKLMNIYADCFAKYKIAIGQVLLTKDDIEDHRRYTNIRYTLDKLLHYKCMPIINENDTTVTDELIGDNDRLAATLAAKLQADALIILSDVDGVFTANPILHPDAELIDCIENITNDLIASVIPPKSAKATKFGTGGMQSKLSAAKFATYEGINVMIGNGKKPGTLEKILTGKGGGTFFPAHKRLHNARRQWLLQKKTNGGVLIDDGALHAIKERKKSLLSAGVKGVVGTFKVGDVITIMNMQEKVVGRGVVNYSAAEMIRIKGLSTAMIKRILGERHYDEAIHRDNLVVD